jgi:hypothetical protein
MPASSASTQLESDLPRLGNPARFNKLGKCSSECVWAISVDGWDGRDSNKPAALAGEEGMMVLMMCSEAS